MQGTAGGLQTKIRMARRNPLAYTVRELASFYAGKVGIGRVILAQQESHSFGRKKHEAAYEGGKIYGTCCRFGHCRG